MPERLDKLIASNFNVSRKDAKAAIRSGQVTVGGKTVNNPDEKINDGLCISFCGKICGTSTEIFIMMNKPKGVLTATRDLNRETVVDLVGEELKRKDLFPVGRLDKDTTGLLIITNNGDYAHRLVAPNHHVKKVYRVTLDGEISDSAIKGFYEGVTLADGELCKPATLERTEDKHIVKVTLREGKYHQIKRMFGVYGLGVNELHREQIGNLFLDEKLEPGECRRLTEEEILLAEEK